jgi:uncharacterized protein (DUF4415 family)
LWKIFCNYDLITVPLMLKERFVSKDAIAPEILAFEDALLRSLECMAPVQAESDIPEAVVARRGRPLGSFKANPKVSTTIRFDQDILEILKASGRGWQTRVNDALREWLERQPKAN